MFGIKIFTDVNYTSAFVHYNNIIILYTVCTTVPILTAYLLQIRNITFLVAQIFRNIIDHYTQSVYYNIM